MASNLRRAVLAAALLMTVSGVGLAADATARISVDPAGDSVRIVITHSKKVGYGIESDRSRLRILYTEPVQISPARMRFDDPVVERYRMVDDQALVFQTTKRFGSYESFELNNPFRLVLDLRAAPTRADVREPRSKSRPREGVVLVLDPGHGGVEHGAMGPTGLREKDVTLDLANRLRREIERRAPKISVVLTRDEDRLVGLDERTAIANHNRADLFMSIHLNASHRLTATGAETYYLSTGSSETDERLVAEHEGAGYKTTGFEGRPDLDLVLWDLAQNVHLAESAALANTVQEQMNRLTGTRNRGVRQAPFRVLRGATMPAILIEVGFISNPAAEAQFKSFGYRQAVVEAMATAVEEFLGNLQRLSRPRPHVGRGTGGP